MKRIGGIVRVAVEVIVRNGRDVRHEIQSKYLGAFVVLGVTGKVVQLGQLRVQTAVPARRYTINVRYVIGFSGHGGVILD